MTTITFFERAGIESNSPGLTYIIFQETEKPGMRKHPQMCDVYTRQLGNVSAPTQVLNAVPETFFSALRNSAKARVWDSLARSFPTASLWREKDALSPFQRSLRSLPPPLSPSPPRAGDRPPPLAP